MTAPTSGRGDWRAVHDEALRRISQREWAPGALIPAETELAEEFGCARATVNRALRELAAAGLIERRRKAGTRVAERPVRQARLSVPVICEDIEAAGALYAYSLIGAEEREAPPQIRARIKGAGRLLHVAALHFANAAPYVFEERWINLDIVPEAAEPGLFAEVSANEWLVRHAPFAGGDMVLSSEPADKAEAAALGVAKGAPLLIMERLTRANDAPITLARLAYAPGRRLTLEI